MTDHDIYMKIALILRELLGLVRSIRHESGSSSIPIVAGENLIKWPNF